VRVVIPQLLNLPIPLDVLVVDDSSSLDQEL
jgi:hypothetical protein